MVRMTVWVAVSSALLALCAPDYVKGAPDNLLKVRTNQCTYQLGTEKSASSPNADWVLTVKDVAFGDGKTCWVQLTRPTGNPMSTVGCVASLKARVCTWRWKGYGTAKPKLYRIAQNANAAMPAWKPVP